MAAVLVVTAGTAIALVSRLDANLTVAALEPASGADELSSALEFETDADAVNVLVLGSDGRDAGDGRFGEDDGTRRSDSMMLVHVAADNARIDAVQIPRDTVLDLPACSDVGHGAFGGGWGMINAAFNYGENCSVRAVAELTGIEADHVLSLNFDGFATVVDAVGGIRVCLADPIHDGHSLLDLPAGEQELDGEQALGLARVRYAIGDGSDIARMENQQMVMSAIVQRATSTEVLARPDRLYALLDAVTSSLTVDEGLASVARLAGLALRVDAVPDEAITFLTMPWRPAAADPNRVEPADDADRVWAAIAADEPLQLEEPDALPETPADDQLSGLDDGATEEHDASERIDAVTRTAADPVC
ncbi:LCP family protein [Microbacterium sp. JZ101]